MRTLIWFLCLCLCIKGAQAADAPAPASVATKKFEALRFNKIKMHTGPGSQYPVEWIYQRQGLPVEVLAAYESWRKIADPDGTTGWVQDTMLSEKRTTLTQGPQRPLRQDPQPDAPTIAYVDPGVVGRVAACGNNWCRIKFGDYEGWLEETNLWGIGAGETFK